MLKAALVAGVLSATAAAAAGPVTTALAQSVRSTAARPAPAPTAPAMAVRLAYAPPVEGPVVDHFRPPTSPYGPGNLGIDYAPPPHTAVRAAATGTVVFAGQVGGTLHVVVAHADGLRTSYSFLASVAVGAGVVVARGATLGEAGPDLHFGVRRGGTYLDPEAILAGVRPIARLVPEPLG